MGATRGKETLVKLALAGSLAFGAGASRVSAAQAFQNSRDGGNPAEGGDLTPEQSARIKIQNAASEEVKATSLWERLQNGELPKIGEYVSLVDGISAEELADPSYKNINADHAKKITDELHNMGLTGFGVLKDAPLTETIGLDGFSVKIVNTKANTKSHIVILDYGTIVVAPMLDGISPVRDRETGLIIYDYGKEGKFIMAPFTDAVYPDDLVSTVLNGQPDESGHIVARIGYGHREQSGLMIPMMVWVRDGVDYKKTITLGFAFDIGYSNPEIVFPVEPIGYSANVASNPEMIPTGEIPDTVKGPGDVPVAGEAHLGEIIPVKGEVKAKGGPGDGEGNKIVGIDVVEQNIKALDALPAEQVAEFIKENRYKVAPSILKGIKYSNHPVIIVSTTSRSINEVELKNVSGDLFLLGEAVWDNGTPNEARVVSTQGVIVGVTEKEFDGKLHSYLIVRHYISRNGEFDAIDIPYVINKVGVRELQEQTIGLPPSFSATQTDEGTSVLTDQETLLKNVGKVIVVRTVVSETSSWRDAKAVSSPYGIDFNEKDYGYYSQREKLFRELVVGINQDINKGVDPSRKIDQLRKEFGMDGFIDSSIDSQEEIGIYPSTNLIAFDSNSVSLTSGGIPVVKAE